MQKIKCRKCNLEYDAPISGNDIYFCPKCHVQIACKCEYGFGPITPCSIYVGDKEVAQITGRIKYRVDSDVYGIHRELSGGYKDLAAYEEATDIIAEYLKGME